MHFIISSCMQRGITIREDLEEHIPVKVGHRMSKSWNLMMKSIRYRRYMLSGVSALHSIPKITSKKMLRHLFHYFLSNLNFHDLRARFSWFSVKKKHILRRKSHSGCVYVTIRRFHLCNQFWCVCWSTKVLPLFFRSRLYIFGAKKTYELLGGFP